MRLNTGHRIASNEQTGRGGLTEAHVRFGSLADICNAKRYVRFTPNNDRKSRHLKNIMSAFTAESGHVRCTSSCPLRGQKRTFQNVRPIRDRTSNFSQMVLSGPRVFRWHLRPLAHPKSHLRAIADIGPASSRPHAQACGRCLGW
jgi:hypothetical protein